MVYFGFAGVEIEWGVASVVCLTGVLVFGFLWVALISLGCLLFARISWGSFSCGVLY